MLSVGEKVKGKYIIVRESKGIRGEGRTTRKSRSSIIPTNLHESCDIR
jgi:hypothetical protein